MIERLHAARRYWAQALFGGWPWDKSAARIGYLSTLAKLEALGALETPDPDSWDAVREAWKDVVRASINGDYGR